jgi:katanin p60 ATPase-containing subunit A1
MVLATCNRPWDLDEAMRRRLERRIYVPLPDQRSREQMLAIHTKGLLLAPSVCLSRLASDLDGFSGADVQLVCRDAALMEMRKAIFGRSPDEIVEMQARGSLEADLTEEDFAEAVRRTAPSVGADELGAYVAWNAEFGCIGGAPRRQLHAAPAA